MVRAVIVAFNPKAGELQALLATLEDAVNVPHEIVIVDNGSDPAQIDAAGVAAGARIIRSGKNLGYGQAANLGAQGSTAEWLLILNQDLVLESGSVDELIENADHWPIGGVFGPLIRSTDGTVYPSARRFPRLLSGAGHALLANIWPSNPFTRTYHATTATDADHTADWLSGSCLLFRREAFEEVGGFDDSFFMFFEDTQMGEQMKAAGWKCVYVPQATVCHEQGTSWKGKPAAMLRAHHESAAHYLDGVYSARYQAPLRWALRAGLKIRASFETRRI